jgi:acidic type I keratin
MTINAGERFVCSDSGCGCEVEVKTASRMQSRSGAGSSFGDSSGSSSASASGSLNAGNRVGIGGSSTDSPRVGSLRSAESQAISTPGDYGSQGATGEGTFGTSGGTHSAGTSGRYGSGSGSSHSGSSTRENVPESIGSDQQSQGFVCCCGKKMSKSGGQGQAASAGRAY